MHIIIILAILWGIGVQIFRFLRWVGNQARSVNTEPSPIQQAIADAQKQARPPQALAKPRLAPVPRTQRPDAGFGRRPEAGGPAVPVPATDSAFREQIEQMVAEEPQSALSPALAPANAAARPLFSDSSDLVRALILQEVFGPPLSRRRPMAMPDQPSVSE